MSEYEIADLALQTRAMWVSASATIGTGLLQSALIGWGMWLMTQAGRRRDRELDAHTAMLNAHTKTLNAHTETLNAHTGTLNAHTETLNAHTETLNAHTEALNASTEALKELLRRTAKD